MSTLHDCRPCRCGNTDMDHECPAPNVTSEHLLREMANTRSRYRQPTDHADKRACGIGADALALLREVAGDMPEGRHSGVCAVRQGAECDCGMDLPMRVRALLSEAEHAD